MILERDEIMEALQKTCLVFTIIGAINWLLVGMLDFNLVDYLFGTTSIISKIIYIVVGKIYRLVNITNLYSH